MVQDIQRFALPNLQREVLLNPSLLDPTVRNEPHEADADQDDNPEAYQHNKPDADPDATMQGDINDPAIPVELPRFRFVDRALPILADVERFVQLQIGNRSFFTLNESVSKRKKAFNNLTDPRKSNELRIKVVKHGTILAYKDVYAVFKELLIQLPQKDTDRCGAANQAAIKELKER